MFSQDCLQALPDKDKARQARHKARLDMDTSQETVVIQMMFGKNGITNIDLPIPIYLLRHRPLMDLPHKDLLKAPHKDPLVGHMVVIPMADQVDQVEDKADQAFQALDQADQAFQVEDPADQASPAEDQVFKDQDKQQNAGSLPRPGHQEPQTPQVLKPIYGC